MIPSAQTMGIGSELYRQIQVFHMSTKMEALAKLAAEEAEELARKMAEAAKLFLGRSRSRSVKRRAVPRRV